MRWLAAWALVPLCVACGQTSSPQPDTSAAVAVQPVNPARIDRARDLVPDGYEVARYSGPASPISLWGLRDAASADPPHCLALGAPTVDPATVRGWSASGAGGIIYAVAAATPDRPDAGLIGGCRDWQVTAAPSSATVTEIPAPAVDSAVVYGMSTQARTVVEGGTETGMHADTFVAYLDGHVCFVTVVTDPGAGHPALTPDDAADLLTETVAALRG
ncbi:DUF5642 family protein [Mycobacterium sp. SMC-4]|uniref:DUF5642 family protein n=1 Tax=Mycobacterium sp. SMC-4 TaxID=2857059 RepID=UPI0021B4C4CF|nr:DUF5642 family protein [Mycobacterium sp. SMC-4]UXA17158.1 DUF5642 family protein [Mycobacterium sp. SMC-4]